MDAPVSNLFKAGSVLFLSPGSLPKAISAGLFDVDKPAPVVVPLSAPTKNAAIGAQSAIQRTEIQINTPISQMEDFPAPIENKIPWGIVALAGAIGAVALLT